MNKVVHFEIPMDDVERGQKFYKDLFGWQVIPMQEMPYWIVRTGPTDDNHMCTEPGFINGGLMRRDSEKDPSGMRPVLVLEVENCEEHSKKVEEAGGKIVMPMIQVGDMGLYSRVEDTEGNVIGLWQTLKK